MYINFFCNDINSYSLCIDFQPLYISYKIVSVFKFEEIVNRFKFAIEGVLRRIWCEEFKGSIYSGVFLELFQKKF